MSRFRRTDDGSVAVLAAVTFPVVLAAVGMAMASYVWSSSEHETQRAADTAAVRAAATAFLGSDFPYEEVPGLTGPVTYPSASSIAANAHQTPPADLTPCGTVGLPPSAEQVPPDVTLPNDCSGVGPFAVPPALGADDVSLHVACDTAREAMSPDSATYANGFYAGSADSQPSCDTDQDGQRRIQVDVATGSPLVGFGAVASDAAGTALDTHAVPELASVRQALASLGVHLDTSLPSLMCPEVSVKVDQPVREPLFDRDSVPNGRASARRVVKNAVVVPVYQGRTIEPMPAPVMGAASGTGVVVNDGATQVHVDPVNLNSLLIDAQKDLLTLLDEVDAVIDAALRRENITLDQLNGTYSGIDPRLPQPPPAPGTEPLRTLRATKCLRDTLTQIYDPPSGDAPTADEVLAQAAASGEEVVVVQVGAITTNCLVPGAIDVGLPGLPAVPTITPTPDDDCVRAATHAQWNPLTGMYEVPFFDATPVLVQDVGDHNFETVPLHASQASGAFRGALVRHADNERYDPDTTEPTPTYACQVVVPLPTSPTTACAILENTPSPSVSAPVPVPSPSTTAPTLPPVVLPTSPTPTATTSPTPSPTPTPTPTPTCKILCGVL